MEGNQAVCRVRRGGIAHAVIQPAVDCHSGFGIHDRVWFPYAHTAVYRAALAEIHALTYYLEKTHPNHRYVFEP